MNYDWSQQEYDPAFERQLAVVIRTFGVERAKAFYAAEGHISQILTHEWPVIDPVQDVAAIRRIRMASADLAIAFQQLNGAAFDLLQDRLLFLARHKRWPNALPGEASEAGGKLLNILIDNVFLREEMDRLLRLVEDEIPRRHEARTALGRMNIDAIIVVDSCRKIWKNLAGKDAPAKRLNPATPFGAFLEEMMQAAAVDANIESAFRAWAKELARVNT